MNRFRRPRLWCFCSGVRLPFSFDRTVQELSSPMSTTPKYVYSFGGGKADGRADMKELLGGKGANLAEMSSIGIPVPPGFTITTEVCHDYYEADRKLPEAVKPQVEAALEHGGGARSARSSATRPTRCW